MLVVEAGTTIPAHTFAVKDDFSLKEIQNMVAVEAETIILAHTFAVQGEFSGKEKNSYACCGSRNYNPRSHVCCASRVLWKGLSNSRDHYAYCGSRNYNPRTHFCCGGLIFFSIHVGTRIAFCGCHIYDTYKLKCCRRKGRIIVSRFSHSHC